MILTTSDKHTTIIGAVRNLAGDSDGNKRKFHKNDPVGMDKPADNTTDKSVEEVLRVNDVNFHLLVDSANTGILLVQGENIIYINQALAGMCGYTVDECKHLNYWDLEPRIE